MAFGNNKKVVSAFDVIVFGHNKKVVVADVIPDVLTPLLPMGFPWQVESLNGP